MTEGLSDDLTEDGRLVGAADAGRPGPSRLRVNIALQGGGSHGAFAWGVLDRLLEEDDLEIPGVVGTSAGAMNAVMLAAGLASGGHEGARSLLDAFWDRVSHEGAPRFGPATFAMFGPAAAAWAWAAAEVWGRAFSPYQFNPLNYNPLRRILEQLVDFSLLRDGRVKLFLCATNVLTGDLRVFDQTEIGPDHVLASACLPTVFQAVRIGDDYYWDGGYLGNPAIFPVIYNTTCEDVLIIQINPRSITRLPTTPQEIADRVNTISFNSSLQRELRAITFVSGLVEEGVLDATRFKRLNVHMIDAEEELRGLGAQSKFDTDPRFLAELRAIGRRRASEWLARNGALASTP
ncbi:alpha/beta hydrolase [Alsobacter soli]|uniref:Alpha/beta hydrolase n=1 Tax=Alsobacter soli TaxID=2109933 RepID=A0A2T1HV73_9HYPH|nr:patatin-like phospholipase family protein [Alsobacter soli]PSC05528.1 alpha/beta hydrolase [Alsobacter soli]